MCAWALSPKLLLVVEVDLGCRTTLAPMLAPHACETEARAGGYNSIACNEEAGCLMRTGLTFSAPFRSLAQMCSPSGTENLALKSASYAERHPTKAHGG
jgi:hypothetical protein